MGDTETKHLTPAGCVIKAFGSAAEVAEVLGLNPTAVYKWTWPGRYLRIDGSGSDNAGEVPQHHHRRLLAEAKARWGDRQRRLTAADLIDGRGVR